MDRPVKIDFQGSEPSEALQRFIGAQFDVLLRFYTRITSCYLKIATRAGAIEMAALSTSRYTLVCLTGERSMSGRGPTRTLGTAIYCLRSAMPSGVRSGSFRTKAAKCETASKAQIALNSATLARTRNRMNKSVRSFAFRVVCRGIQR